MPSVTFPTHCARTPWEAFNTYSPSPVPESDLSDIRNVVEVTAKSKVSLQHIVTLLTICITGLCRMSQ